MKTVADFINYVNLVVPNAMVTSDKTVFLQDICKDIKEYNTYYDTWDTNSSTNASFYNFPTTDINWRDVLWVGVSNSTYDVAISPSTIPYSDYTEYKYKGLDESVDIQQWCEVGTSGVTFYGLSTANKHWLRYKCLPPLVFGTASSDSTTIIKVDDTITTYIQNKLAAVVCRSGAFPRIDLGNNYEMEALEYLAKLKLRMKQIQTKTAKYKTSYKYWW